MASANGREKPGSLLGTRTRDEWVELDRRHVWRPFTASTVHASEDPFVFVRGEGPYLFDADGTRYFDAQSSWWTVPLGHRHPKLMAVLKRQADELVHCAMASATNPHAIQLAKQLVDIAPAGLERVLFSDDGSTAVEAALKMAFQYWRQNGRPERTLFLSLAGAYHGDTHGAMSVGDLEEFQGLFAPLLFEVIRAPDPTDEDGWERAVTYLEERLERDGDRICGVVVEPLVQGVAGMRIWPPSLLRRLRAATNAADTFLIADEVFTGLGRTGAMWACDHAGVVPDLLCSAKALGGGVLPIAATLATARIYDGFRGDIDRALMHGHTFTGHPLGCAIASEFLTILEEEAVLQGIESRERRLRELGKRLTDLPYVRRPRQLGMVSAFDVGDGGYGGRRGWRVAEEARRLGVYLRPLGDVVYLCPPLNISIPDLERLCNLTEQAVRQALPRARE